MKPRNVPNTAKLDKKQVFPFNYTYFLNIRNQNSLHEDDDDVDDDAYHDDYEAKIPILVPYKESDKSFPEK